MAESSPAGCLKEALQQQRAEAHEQSQAQLRKDSAADIDQFKRKKKSPDRLWTLPVNVSRGRKEMDLFLFWINKLRDVSGVSKNEQILETLILIIKYEDCAD